MPHLRVAGDALAAREEDCFNGYVPKIKKLAERLQQMGVEDVVRSVGATWIKGHGRLQMVAAAGKIKACKYLIEDFGLNVNWSGTDGATPLAFAIQGWQECVEVLFPVTAPLARVADWSIDGLLLHARFMSSHPQPECMDPYLASYGVENPIYAVLQLAHITMRNELRKITLDKTFEERDALNEKIVSAINDAATNWGLKCIRYEIKGKKQAQILESEGKRTAQILESEGAMLDVANRVKGEVEAVFAKSEATASGMRLVSEAMTAEGSAKAASLELAEQYIEAFSNLAQKTNTVLLPGKSASRASFVAQARKTYHQIHSHSQALKNHPQIQDQEESGETSPAALVEV